MGKRYLVLEDGSVYEGIGFGYDGGTSGEVVFLTSMTGVTETLTDAGFYGQIVVQTFPQIGNYGIMTQDVESAASTPCGYVVDTACDQPSNYRMDMTLDAFLKQKKIVGICDVDIRAIVKNIRSHGTMNGAITDDPKFDAKKLSVKNEAFLTDKVSTKEVVTRKTETAEYEVVVVDFGVKNSILDALNRSGCNVTIVPHTSTVDEIMAYKPDGVVLSNGPGDPNLNVKEIETVRELIKKKVPIFGICYGHLVLALAVGAQVDKLKFGHRGANQGVMHLASKDVLITTQNHGYVVDTASLPAQCEMTFVNVNDKTCEGLKYTGFAGMSVQFYPKKKVGENDTMDLYEEFNQMMEDARNA